MMHFYKFRGAYLNKFRTDMGLAVVELVVAAAVIIVIFTGVFGAAQITIRSQRAATLNRRATLVAAEAIEVARYERDADWTTFSGHPLDTNLYPDFGGGQPELSTTDPGAVDGVFTRTVRLSTVYRDGSGDIASSGVPDASARDVTVSVSWTDPIGTTRTVTIGDYLMDI